MHSVGQKVFARHPRPVNGKNRFKLGTIVFAHDCTASESYVQHGKILYDIIFQADKVLITRVPQSAIRNSHQSIFWRLLRPEFVKHRGRSLTEKYFPVSEVPNPSVGALSGEKVPVKLSNPRTDVTGGYHYRSTGGEDDIRSSLSHRMVLAHTQQLPASSLRPQSLLNESQNPLHAGPHNISPTAPSSGSGSGSYPLSSNPSSAVRSTTTTRAAEAPCETSAYSAAEDLFECQAASISRSVSSAVLSASKGFSTDANYTTADGICAGTDSGMSTDGIRKDGSNSYSDGSVSSRSYTGDEYHHHYNSMNRNKTYFNFDNYLQYQIDNYSSIDPFNPCESSGGVDSSGSREESKSIDVHDDACTYGHADGMLSYQSDFSIHNQNPNNFLHSATPSHSSYLESLTSNPCNRLSASQISPVEANRDFPSYVPSYSGGELLFDYQSTAPSSVSAQAAKNRDPGLTGIAVNPSKSNRNSARRNRVRSRSEDVSRNHLYEAPSLVDASAAVEALKSGLDDSHIKETRTVDNQVRHTDSGHSINVDSKPVSAQSKRVKGRSGSLGTAPGSHSECLVGTCGAGEKILTGPQTLIPDCNKTKDSAVPLNVPGRAAVRGSSGLPAAAATEPKDPPPLSADSLSAFSGNTEYSDNAVQI